MKHYETIIIGGGISGLACAHTLSSNGYKDFALITPEIGGRIETSKDDKVNYGAYFLTPEYTNVIPFTTVQKKIKISDVMFHKKNQKYKVFDPHFFPYIPSFIRFIRILYKFQRRFRKFKKRCEVMSQKQALEADPYLLKLFNKSAGEFIRENKFENLIREYVGELIYGMVFIDANDTSTFFFLRWSYEMILCPVYEFHFEKEKMIRPFKKKHHHGYCKIDS